MEDALINNQTLLEQLRHGFMSADHLLISFVVEIEVLNGSAVPCFDNQEDQNAFCPLNSPEDHILGLCPPQEVLVVTFVMDYDQNFLLPWLSIVHGSLLLLLVASYHIRPNIDAVAIGDVALTIRIERVDCNPSLYLVECVTGNLFSWVSH